MRWILYYLLLAVTSAACLGFVVAFWPNYNHSEFVLFIDFTVFVFFLPSYFILNWGIVPHLLKTYVLNRYLHYYLIGYVLMSFTLILFFIELNVVMIGYSLLCGLVGIMYFIAIQMLYKSCKPS